MANGYPAALLVALFALGGCGTGPEGQEMTQQADVRAKLEQLEQQAGGRLVRVILSVAEDGEAAIAAVTTALLEAGATSVDPIEGTALLVVEAQVEALRAAARTGLVTDVVVDEPFPPTG